MSRYSDSALTLGAMVPMVYVLSGLLEPKFLFTLLFLALSAILALRASLSREREGRIRFSRIAFSMLVLSILAYAIELGKPSDERSYLITILALSVSALLLSLVWARSYHLYLFALSLFIASLSIAVYFQEGLVKAAPRSYWIVLPALAVQIIKENDLIPRYSAGSAVTFLLVAAVVLSTGDDALANSFAMLAYFSLLISVLTNIISYARSSRNRKGSFLDPDLSK